MKFAGKVAIITGAGSGIGAAYAAALAQQGAAVVIAEINESAGRLTAEAINQSAGGRALFVKTDVSSADSCTAMAEAAAAAFGGIDLLINNAAIYGSMETHPIMDVSLDYLDKFFKVNITGALIAARAVYKHMAARGGGAIVNQSSAAAWMNYTYYSVSKAAINSLTQVMAAELAPHHIRVNAVAPGLIDTPGTQSAVPQSAQRATIEMTPLQRIGTVADVTELCLFLLADSSAFVTGQIWRVDGGMIMQS